MLPHRQLPDGHHLGEVHRQLGDPLFRDAAARALRHVMRAQNITTTNADVRGAIKGSHPIWGAYSRLTFPNWPTKFFIDAMLLSADFFA